MPEVVRRDIEEGNGPDPQLTSSPPPQGQSNFGDSSGPLFSMYSKAADEEDNKMVERWQKDADGILIFTGLFSAAVATLLAVTIQDLRPNSQDISAFYLGNIYQVLADPNATRSSIPSPVAKPPKFTPPRFAIWVNSLWSLSLVMSLSCALLATFLHQWARRYLRMAQPALCSPEKRARMRAFFSNGVEKMHVPWAVETLPTMLHVSLFLFFGGLLVFLFNIDHEVFISVVWLIGLFSMVYGLITVLPIIRHDSPYSSPLSTPAWFLYASVHHLTFKILASISGRTNTPGGFWSLRAWRRFEDLRERYHRWILGGVEKAAEEAASEQSSEIDVQILDWTICALGDDDSLKNFFEAIPGFFNSKLVKHLKSDFPKEHLQKFADSFGGFLGRTWSSNSVNDSEKLCQLDMAMNTMSLIHRSGASLILRNIILKHWDEVPQSVEMGHTLAPWCTSSDRFVAWHAQGIIAKILVNVRERNDIWVTLAAQVFGLPEQDLRDNIALGGDNVLLASMIHFTSQYLRSDYFNFWMVRALSKLDIHNTLPRLQHEFCTLWNEVLQEARNQSFYSNPVCILRWIRHLYISLHQGTDAALTAFSASTNEFDDILFMPSSYPLCNLASHRPDSIPQIPVPTSCEVPLSLPPGNSLDALSPSLTDGSNTASRQPEQTSNVMEPPSSPNPTTTSEVGATSHSCDMTPPTNPIHSSSYPADASPTAVVATAPQDITSTTTSSHPLEGNEQQDLDKVVPSVEPGTTPSPSRSLPNTQPEPYDVGVDSSHLSPPSIGSSIPSSCPTGSTTLPHPRARGLVNTGNVCFANTVLQLLVNSPPFCNLFRELGDLRRRPGAAVPETGGGATPLVDATVKFLKEFIVQESPLTQQQSKPATGGTSRADEERKDDNVVDSLEPTYMYDAMKGKKQLKLLLDGQQQDAEEFLCQYLNALDEELVAQSLAPRASISGRQFASAAIEVEEREVSIVGQAEVGNRGFLTGSIESPLTRIFSGRFRSTVRAPNQPDTVTIENWRSLQLDIQHDSVHTVEDALARISHPQPVRLDPFGINEASQQTLIEVLPPVLVIHLKRFLYDPAIGGVVKIGKPIRFTAELEIPPDITVPIAQKPTGAQPGSYALYGVLYHHGVSAIGGHYMVDVLHPNGNGGHGEGWLHIDDETVRAVRHEDVFGGHYSGQTDDWCPYMLFYRRTTSTGTS